MMPWIESEDEGETTASSSSSSPSAQQQQENKTIYICIQKPDSSHFWFIITPHHHCTRTISFNQYPEISLTYPQDLQDLNCYSFTVLYQSIIFFIGGEIRENHAFSNNVFAFNTSTGIWLDNISNMQSSRAFHSAVAVRSKIYVFGCSSVGRNLTPEQWGECYDYVTNTWIYLPKPPDEVYNVSDISSHAVYEKENLILLWVFSLGVYFFNFDSSEWISSFLYPTPIHQGPRWSNRVAVVDDVMYWHYFGTIYAYDFSKGEKFELYHFEDSRDKFGQRLAPDPDGIPRPTYLVHLGEGILGLVWLDFFGEDMIYCYKFRVEREGDGTLSLLFEDSVDFRFEGYQIEDVLEI